jgi:hypothetical protein
LSGGAGPDPQFSAFAHLRVASWDLSQSPLRAASTQRAKARPTWRTTFGSERQTEEVVTSAGPGIDIDADAVLLQGVSDPAAIRRLFPARDWRVVISRPVAEDSPLRPSDVATPDQDDGSKLLTGVAIRARKGLRISRRDQVLGVPGIDGESPVPASWATAVRLVDRGNVLWLLSLALPETCAEGAACEARDRIAKWQQEKRGAGEATVVGGRLGVRLSRDAEPLPCPGQSIETYIQQTEPRRAQAVPDEDKGCIALVELAR